MATSYSQKALLKTFWETNLDTLDMLVVKQTCITQMFRMSKVEELPDWFCKNCSKIPKTTRFWLFL